MFVYQKSMLAERGNFFLLKIKGDRTEEGRSNEKDVSIAQQLRQGQLASDESITSFLHVEEAAGPTPPPLLNTTFAHGDQELTGLSPSPLGGFDQAALRIVPAAHLNEPRLDQHRRQFGIHFAQDAPTLGGAPFIDLSIFFPEPKEQFNGLITNDKFCLSRRARLQLSWWRLPRNARQTISAGVESPGTGNTEEYLRQQEAHNETTIDLSASLRGTA